MDSRPKTIYPRAMFRTGAQMSILVLLTGLFLFWTAQAGHMKAVDDAISGRAALLDGMARQLAAEKGWARKPAIAPVCLVAIDDNSVANHPWPWTPLDFSLFAQAIVPFGPEVIAISEVLDWDRSNIAAADRQKLPQYEKILHDSLLRCPRLLLASELGLPEDPSALPPAHEAPFLRRVKGNLLEVPEWIAIEHEPREEYRLSAAIGFTNLPQNNPAMRSVPLVLRYQGRVVPSLVLQAVLLSEKLTLDDVSIELGSHAAIGQNL